MHNLSVRLVGRNPAKYTRVAICQRVFRVAIPLLQCHIATRLEVGPTRRFFAQSRWPRQKNSRTAAASVF